MIHIPASVLPTQYALCNFLPRTVHPHSRQNTVYFCNVSLDIPAVWIINIMNMVNWQYGLALYCNDTYVIVVRCGGGNFLIVKPIQVRG